MVENEHLVGFEESAVAGDGVEKLDLENILNQAQGVEGVFVLHKVEATQVRTLLAIYLHSSINVIAKLHIALTRHEILEYQLTILSLIQQRILVASFFILLLLQAPVVDTFMHVLANLVFALDQIRSDQKGVEG